jgi:hypothetical protein
MSADGGARFCHLCGGALNDHFYRYAHGLVVCVTCERKRPHCARCGVPIAANSGSAADSSASSSAAHRQGGAHVAGPPLCAHCLRTAPRCACCGTPIAQNWYTFEELLPPAAVRRFCEPCVLHRPHCDICRAPVGPGAPVLPDGQLRCALCASEMVLDDAAVRAVYAEALARADHAARVRPAQVPALVIVGRRRMGDVRRRFAGEIPRSEGGHHVLGFFVREGGAASIYVELGLPRPLLLGTLAHELAHAWQVEVSPGVRDPMVREGFAEWVAHRVLVAGGHRRVAARATRRDDLYGRGLRHFLEIERNSGRTAVLVAARGERK